MEKINQNECQSFGWPRLAEWFGLCNASIDITKKTGMYATELQIADLYDADATPAQKLNKLERGSK